MKRVNVDVAIVGAGTAGMSAYKAALKHTSSVVVIEGQHYGTTCARVGCMPSKLLIAAAEAAHSVHHAGALGIYTSGANVDGFAVMKRVRDERDRFVGFVLDSVESWPPEHRLLGQARFLDDHTLQVDEHSQVVAKRIVIATGSYANVSPEWRRVVGERLIINDDVFQWDTLPKSVAVLGAGVIALELAQALHRLGVKIRLYGRSARLGPLTDPALQALTLRILGDEFPIQMEAGELHLQRDGADVVVAVGRDVRRFEWLLAASGRSPNLSRLDLSRTTLPLNVHGVPLYDSQTGRIGESHVFIAGDALDESGILHEAADEGRIAGDNAGRFPDVTPRQRRTPMAVVFSSPQIMLVGKSYAQLIESGVDFTVGEVSFTNQGRSRVMRKNKGALHLYAARDSGQLLGAEMIGPAAEHIAHLLAWSIQRGDTVHEMLGYPFYHPVIEEGLRTGLRNLARALPDRKQVGAFLG